MESPGIFGSSPHNHKRLSGSKNEWMSSSKFRFFFIFIFRYVSIFLDTFSIPLVMHLLGPVFWTSYKYIQMPAGMFPAETWKCAYNWAQPGFTPGWRGWSKDTRAGKDYRYFMTTVLHCYIHIIEKLCEISLLWSYELRFV